jgi:hypothetical protein
MQIVPFKRRIALTLLLPVSVFLVPPTKAQTQAKKSPPAIDTAHLPPNSPWLFAGFKRESKDGVYYAISLDGYHWKLANYYDHYSQGQHYGALFSPDLVHWSDALSRIDFPAGMRHGSFVQISQVEYDRLAALTPAAPSQSSLPQVGTK